MLRSVLYTRQASLTNMGEHLLFDWLSRLTVTGYEPRCSLARGGLDMPSRHASSITQFQCQLTLPCTSYSRLSGRRHIPCVGRCLHAAIAPQYVSSTVCPCRYPPSGPGQVMGETASARGGVCVGECQAIYLCSISP